MKLNQDITISVNVNSRQLEQMDFITNLKYLLSPYPASYANHLEFEILESSTLSNLEKTSSLIKECNNIGVTFSLDDFGVGYSSLTYLKKLPIKYIKIDQSFIAGILNNPSDLAILEAIFSIAKSVGVQMIAEGIETSEHARLLLQLGCELGQGFAIAKPMRADQFEQWHHSWKPDPSWQ